MNKIDKFDSIYSISFKQHLPGYKFSMNFVLPLGLQNLLTKIKELVVDC